MLSIAVDVKYLEIVPGVVSAKSLCYCCAKYRRRMLFVIRYCLIAIGEGLQCKQDATLPSRSLWLHYGHWIRFLSAGPLLSTQTKSQVHNSAPWHDYGLDCNNYLAACAKCSLFNRQNNTMRLSSHRAHAEDS